MADAFDYPFILSGGIAIVLWASVYAGSRLRGTKTLEPGERDDFGTVLTATLTLLALLIGFSFSMAAARYDSRKYDEEQEANAIGTAYARATLLPPAQRARARDLLRRYAALRIDDFITRDPARLAQIDAATAHVQSDLWETAQMFAEKRSDAIAALYASGINDVINAQGYTQASWGNRIPAVAWLLMIAIAIACSTLFGFLAQPTKGKLRRSLLVPVVVSVALYLIADLDSPRRGLINVEPNNLVSLQAALK
ncbi:MAG: hypothetical protein JO199_00265 [Candidatus Eremiobacteraeota bacterium]|nr:hypothetical protein [Candidatus Eremiobacteraeota bacterium]